MRRGCGQNPGLNPGVIVKYTLKQVNKALSLFDQIENATLVCRQLGYPSVSVLYLWIRKEGGIMEYSLTLNEDLNIKFPQLRSFFQPILLKTS